MSAHQWICMQLKIYILHYGSMMDVTSLNFFIVSLSVLFFGSWHIYLDINLLLVFVNIITFVFLILSWIYRCQLTDANFFIKLLHTCQTSNWWMISLYLSCFSERQIIKFYSNICMLYLMNLQLHQNTIHLRKLLLLWL